MTAATESGQAKVYRIGFDVGSRVVERLVKDKPLIGSDLDVVKFICKEFWHQVLICRPPGTTPPPRLGQLATSKCTL